MELKAVQIAKPAADLNVIIGQAHFIKTVEDLYEAIVQAVPGVKFGLAFCEASGPCLIRHTGTDNELVRAAIACLRRDAWQCLPSESAQSNHSGHGGLHGFLRDREPTHGRGCGP
jgi:hypothetical protein